MVVSARRSIPAAARRGCHCPAFRSAFARPIRVRLRDGIYECAHCEAVLDVMAGEVQQHVMVAVSEEPNMCVLFPRHREIHRCAVDQPEPPGWPQ